MKMEIDSIQWWSWLSNAFGISVVVLGGIVALLALLGWGFSWKANKLKDEALQKFQTESATLISEANAKAAEANKIAEIAKKDAANLNERAAVLEKEAELAKLETEKLKRQVSWRRITQEQQLEIQHALTGYSFSMYFEYSQSDPEATQFAEDIFKSLKSSPGINVHQPHPLVLPPAPPGVTISGSNGANRNALEKAMISAGIKFVTVNNSSGEPRISIGSRLSPF
jgi:hypothetical protein